MKLYRPQFYRRPNVSKYLTKRRMLQILVRQLMCYYECKLWQILQYVTDKQAMQDLLVCHDIQASVKKITYS